VGGKVPQAISDATRCPRCKSALHYERVILAHVGEWSCPNCGLERPPRDVAASRVRLEAAASEIDLRVPVSSAFDPIRVPLPGLYNAYNALAAIAVSWIWDADFETLASAIQHVVVTGIRSRDLANRLKYAGVPKERVEVVDAWSGAIDRAVGATPPGEELVVIATYTAMQSLRAELARRGHVAPFWED